MFIRFANFYQEFILSFRQIVAPLTLISQAICDLAVNQSIYTKENCIDGIDGRKVIVKANIIGKKSGIGFFTPGERLDFTEFRQAFNTTPILHYFASECFIQMETDVSSYIIGKSLGN